MCALSAFLRTNGGVAQRGKDELPLSHDFVKRNFLHLLGNLLLNDRIKTHHAWYTPSGDSKPLFYLVTDQNLWYAFQQNENV